MLKKHDLAEILIEKFELPNIGVAHTDGKKVVVKNTLPGQKIRMRVTKSRKVLQGALLEVISPADYEINPTCGAYGKCGGCVFQSIDYPKELEFKEKGVLELFEKSGLGKSEYGYEYCGITPSPTHQHYRNKMEFSFGDDGLGGNLTLGMRKRGGMYEAVNAHECNICDEDFNKAVERTLGFFKEKEEFFFHKLKNTGRLRNLVVRKAFFTGEILINLVTTSDFLDNLADEYASEIQSIRFKGILTGIIHTRNDSVSDAVKPDSVRIVYGKDYITEKLLGLSFKISAFSFFQTNPVGAELLYSRVREFAGDTLGKTVFDLYSGTGTIAQIMAQKAKKVIGIELVAEASQKAKENAQENNITNCEFITGDVLKAVPLLTQKPEIIILDPPREGIHPKALPKIIDFKAETIIYVSCNPSSLTENLPYFIEAGYELKALALHDMFPRTGNVEAVAKLQLSH